MEFAVMREMENDMTDFTLPTPAVMRRQTDEMVARGRKAIFGENRQAPVTKKPRPSGMPMSLTEVEKGWIEDHKVTPKSVRPKKDSKPGRKWAPPEPHLSYKPFRGLDQMIIAAFAEGRWT